MLVSYNWLKDYVRIDAPVEEFCDRMIMSGSNLETCTAMGEGIENVKIGRIEKIESHPDADKLVVCRVNVGKEGTLQIVTGASNIYEGAFVPVAIDGAVVPGPLHGHPKTEGGVKITKGELRGVLSEGMMCGPQELGLPDKVAPINSKDGIWLLEGDWTDSLGKDVDKALGLHDCIVDFEITPNRPDCLSMLGMAREAAATFGTAMIYPDTTCEKTISEKASDHISVEVRSDLCRRYTARVIKNVKIEQSPWWLQKRLIAAGMRPINNIVDITNFVMLEYGQPLHAFDIRRLAGGKIIVDVAEDGDRFTTLDGNERELTSDMLMINDAEKPVAIAGVMGGLNSEIEPDTTTVVIESATFVADSVRKTAKKLGMRTEASGRYEKGIDPNLCEEAADRVCKLVEILDCGQVLTGAVDVYKKPETAPTVTARVSRINRVLGIDLSRDEMVKILEGLEIKVEGEGDRLIATPLSVRQDLIEEVDYVEEIARMYGYDNLPMTFPDVQTKAQFSKSWLLRDAVRNILCAMGADEIQTFSFMNHKTLDSAGIAKDSWERAMVELINPMGEDTASMRSILTPGMLEVLGRNYSRNVEAVRAYEIGTVFMKNMADENLLPDESLNLSIGLYGEGEDFFTLKGMIAALLDKIGIEGAVYTPESEYGVYHPGRCARISVRKESGEEIELGIMGEVHPDVAENFAIGGGAYCAELFFNVLVELSGREIQYRQPPKYPSIVRDIALIVDEDVTVGRMEEVIREAADELLREVKLFDIYRGAQVGEGKKSAAFSLTYRHDERTLTDEEADAAHAAIAEALREKVGAKIRDN